MKKTGERLVVGERTWKELEQVQRMGYDYSSVFNDFVDCAINVLLSMTDNMQREDFLEKVSNNKLDGIYEDRYLALVRRYKENKTLEMGKRPIDYFVRAWEALQQEAREYEHDVLGEIFMTKISQGEHGQFFTPIHVCDMMAEMTGSSEGQTVSDPCCGSGRFFISMAKKNKGLKFTGVDLSLICVKMAVLNMWLFNLDADVYHGDTLTQEMNTLWMVRKGGYVMEKPVN